MPHHPRLCDSSRRRINLRERTAPIFLLAVALAVTSCADTETNGCGASGPCEVGYYCYEKQCIKQCNGPSDCDGEDCIKGLCRPTTSQCAEPSDCNIAPGPCQTTEGVTCIGGACNYPNRAENTPCDDQDPCTPNSACNGSGVCTGEPMDCSVTPGPECLPSDVVRVFEGEGSCDNGVCVFSYQELNGCTECPACLEGCLIDTDGDTTPDLVGTGTVNATNGCEVCAPVSSRSQWSLVSCSQQAPVEVCVESTGTCVSADGCQGEACCTFAPIWPQGSTDAQPACPFGGEDPNGNGTQDGGENWSGVCNHDGHCAGCTGDGFCDDGNGCTVNTCDDDGVCQKDTTSLLGQPCTVLNDNDGTCISTGVSAVCRIDNGRACSDDNTCASGFCIDAVCCASSCDGNCSACNVSGDGTCTAMNGDCFGNCFQCSPSGFGSARSFVCSDNQNVCFGTCSVCQQDATEVTRFDCAGNPALCSGDCLVSGNGCQGSGNSFSCVGDVNKCSGNCAVCDDSDRSVNCAANDNACSGECVHDDLCVAGGAGSFDCASDPSKCDPHAACTAAPSPSFDCECGSGWTGDGLTCVEDLPICTATSNNDECTVPDVCRLNSEGVRLCQAPGAVGERCDTSTGDDDCQTSLICDASVCKIVRILSNQKTGNSCDQICDALSANSRCLSMGTNVAADNGCMYVPAGPHSCSEACGLACFVTMSDAESTDCSIAYSTNCRCATDTN